LLIQGASLNGRNTLPLRYGIATIALVFSLLTISSGGQVIFGSDQARSAAGNYMPFIVWFNFVAGFAYVVAGIGLATVQVWAGRLALVIAIATALAFLIFGIFAITGTPYELRTVGAMTLRTGLWAGTAWFAMRRI
jgi:hypothetical protein